MLISSRLHVAGEFVEWLRQQIDGHTLPDTPRVRAAAGCLAIAQEHHHAIVRLIEERLYAAAFALVRAAFEAYIRGEWLALCAGDHEVQQFLAGREPPRMDALLTDLEATEGFSAQVLSVTKRNTWKSMCAYTHTGGLHVQRWQTADSIESSYREEELAEVLGFATAIGALTVVGVATISDDVRLAERVLTHYRIHA